MNEQSNKSSRRLAGVKVKGRITLDLDYETNPGEDPLAPISSLLNERLNTKGQRQDQNQQLAKPPHYYPTNGVFPVSDGLISYPQP